MDFPFSSVFLFSKFGTSKSENPQSRMAAGHSPEFPLFPVSETTSPLTLGNP